MCTFSCLTVISGKPPLDASELVPPQIMSRRGRGRSALATNMSHNSRSSPLERGDSSSYGLGTSHSCDLDSRQLDKLGYEDDEDSTSAQVLVHVPIFCGSFSEARLVAHCDSENRPFRGMRLRRYNLLPWPTVLSLRTKGIARGLFPVRCHETRAVPWPSVDFGLG